MSTQHRLHDLLGEFSFHGSKLMGDMRKEVRALGQQSDARHHTLVSEVKRRFHRLESAHRQLEFVASDVFCRNNFRLDSAMKSASGLFRRAQRATSEVDARLEAEALVQVGAERIAARAQAHAKREELREDIDAVADQLVAMIGEYTATVPLTEQYLRPSLSFDAARQRLTDAEQTLRKCQGFMTALAGLREASAEPISIELMDCSVARAPGGMTKRALWAVLATLLTVTGLGYVGRRWRPFPG